MLNSAKRGVVVVVEINGKHCFENVLYNIL